jgi:hypothetical protein
VPDAKTVALLMRAGTYQSAGTLRSILASRTGIIVDHCQLVLEQLPMTKQVTDAQLQMIDVAQQSVTALRHGLIAPAQSAAGNLVDYLLRDLFSPMMRNGKMGYRGTKEHVEKLATENSSPLHLLGAVRELSALMPVLLVLAEWWPHEQDPLPTSFSRHATAHAVIAPEQVNAANALVAVMVAVSLLCQEIDSGWVMISPLRRQARLAAAGHATSATC